jgi:hypothetical protein
MSLVFTQTLVGPALVFNRVKTNIAANISISNVRTVISDVALHRAVRLSCQRDISADEEVMTCGGESYFKERGLGLDVSDSLTS